MVNIEKIVEKLKKARDAYYNTSNLLMSDQEYDSLEETLRQIDSNHPFFESIGHSPSSPWKKVKHNIPMGSLTKAHSEEDIRKWADKFGPGTIYSLQYKLDGLSASLDYDDSEFIRGITRGDGFEGDDITPNIKLMKNLKQTIPGFTGSIRAEIIMENDVFNKINSTLPEKERYTNPRAAASGISRGLDGMYCKYLQIIPYDLLEPINENIKLRKLKEMGFPVTPNCTGKLDNLINLFEKIKQIRSRIPYNIDGVVIKLNDHKAQSELGYSQNKPRAQKAWKFDPPGAATPFIEETWDVGRTGVVTPLANLEPVLIDGSTIRKATLHNIAEIKRLGIGRGDLVMLVKSGDIIPKITAVLEHRGEPIQIPTKCPSCGSELKNDSIKLMCESDTCPGKNFYRILNWITVVEVDGFGESLAMALRDTKKLNCIADLYKLTQEDISSLEGWGKDSAEKIISNLDRTRQLKPETFLTALGIPGISEKTSQDLLKAFTSIENLMEKAPEDIKKIKGYSDISANSITAGIRKYSSEIKELFNIIKLKTLETQGKLSGLSFCFTGEMSQPRSSYEKLVETNGGEKCSSVTKNLSYLVCNENKGSSKSLKAEKYGVKVINESQFLQMVGQTQPNTIENKIKIETVSLFE